MPSHFLQRQQHSSSLRQSYFGKKEGAMLGS
uniref:Uncharacterized protein n=1 Tax=Nelumbo nucifera TaxID=4432 RepID=A0A822XIW0_NELNU|nr:TPA_asm: hypothetical protein HUJ06_020452 [Nelumbo nucifera]